MTPERRADAHAHELERALHARVKRLEQYEREIRDREKRRILALEVPDRRTDDTGFCPGCLI